MPWDNYDFTIFVEQDLEMQRFSIKPYHLFEETGRIDRLEILEGPSGWRTWSDDVKNRIDLERYAPGTKV